MHEGKTWLECNARWELTHLSDSDKKKQVLRNKINVYNG